MVSACFTLDNVTRDSRLSAVLLFTTDCAVRKDVGKVILFPAILAKFVSRQHKFSSFQIRCITRYYALQQTNATFFGCLIGAQNEICWCNCLVPLNQKVQTQHTWNNSEQLHKPDISMFAQTHLQNPNAPLEGASAIFLWQVIQRIHDKLTTTTWCSAKICASKSKLEFSQEPWSNYTSFIHNQHRDFGVPYKKSNQGNSATTAQNTTFQFQKWFASWKFPAEIPDIRDISESTLQEKNCFGPVPKKI